MKEDVVAVYPLDSYNEGVDFAVRELIKSIDDLSWVKPGMKICIKVNLVASMKPEKAGTTNPEIVCAVAKILIEKGAEVIVGDSPGGIYNSAFVNNIYRVTEMKKVEFVGAKLNQNFEQSIIKFPEGKVCREIDTCNYLTECDAIINICKLKTHGMMALSAAVKNMFGTIGGTTKPEYHFKYPDQEQFATMLVDLNECYKCKLNIVDAVIGMEGNGPTQGKPRKIGCLLASKSPYNLDIVCAKIIGLDPFSVPTIKVSITSGLADEPQNVKTTMELDRFLIKDYDLIKKLDSIEFKNVGKGVFAFMFGKIAKKSLMNKPGVVKKQCVGCKKCFNICPAKAITMKGDKPVIDRKKCIKCFCCQEFCPTGAMKVKRPLVAKILNRKKQEK